MGSYSFTAHVNGKVKGRYSKDQYLAFESESSSLRGAFEGLVGQAKGAGAAIWDPYAEAIVDARGDYLLPAHIGEDEEENAALCGPTKYLPAYCRACWSLARTTTGDLKEVDALLLEGFSPDPLVSVQEGLWRPTPAGLSYLDFVRNCVAEKVRLGTDMLPAVDSLIVSCITGGTIQTNLPLIREAVCLGLMESVGTGEAAKMSEQGFTWFFLGGAGLIDTNRKNKSRIYELSRALAFPDYGDRANLIERLPTYALGELIRVTQKQPNIVNVVVENLPLSKWAALSVQIRDLDIHREITKGLKRKHHIQ